MNDNRTELNAFDAALRDRLRAAVHAETPPPELRAKIRMRLDADSRASRGISRWTRPWIAVTAGLVVMLGASVAYQLGHLRFTAAQQESFMTSVVQKVSYTMKAGLDDHLHCSVYGNVPKDVPPLQEAIRYLPDQFRGLLQLVQRASPEPFRLYSAHECRRKGRKFLHFQLKTDSKLLSVIVTRRGPDESFVRDKIVPAMAGATPVYETKAARFQVAAIESGDYLAYVVSDLSNEQNRRIMLAMAPELSEFLARLSA
jgi:hypothetical protein